MHALLSFSVSDCVLTINLCYFAENELLSNEFVEVTGKIKTRTLFFLNNVKQIQLYLHERRALSYKDQ